MASYIRCDSKGLELLIAGRKGVPDFNPVELSYFRGFFGDEVPRGGRRGRANAYVNVASRKTRYEKTVTKIGIGILRRIVTVASRALSISLSSLSTRIRANPTTNERDT